MHSSPVGARGRGESKASRLGGSESAFSKWPSTSILATRRLAGGARKAEVDCGFEPGIQVGLKQTIRILISALKTRFLQT